MGDLRFCTAVQAYSALILAGFVLSSALHPGIGPGRVVGFYGLGMLLETFDKQIFALEHRLSGHTLRHLAVAMAGYWILSMLRK